MKHPSTFFQSLRRAWATFWVDERTAYLSQATDLADLERRERALNRGNDYTVTDRFVCLPSCPTQWRSSC